MFLKFLPTNFNFFTLFEKQADFAVEAIKHFTFIVNKGHVDAADMKKMKEIEHQGDDVAHEIIEHLNKTFITPFDREDIYGLTKELDDVIDMTNTIMNRLYVYKLSGFNDSLKEFADIIEKSVIALAEAVKGLKNMKNIDHVLKMCVEVNRLENEGDALRDNVLVQLFENSKNDPIAVIKWKEVYEDAETILDICEDVAHMVESILVKQA